jgi:hypothetical protein
MKLLDLWTETLDADVRSAAVDGCPKNFIPHSSLDQSNNHVGLSLWKYRTIIEPGNSPFNVDDATSLPVRDSETKFDLFMNILSFLHIMVLD